MPMQFRGSQRLEMIHLEEADLSDYLFAKACESIAETQPDAHSVKAKLTATCTLADIEASLRAKFPKGVYRLSWAIVVKTSEAAAIIASSTTSKHYAFEYRVRAFGNVEAIKAIIKDDIEPKAIEGSRMATWCFSTEHGMSEERVFLKPTHPFHPELYPYIPDIEGMLDRYRVASAPILILSGDPGTGKTSLIRRAIEKFDWSVLTTYDHRVMEQDSFYLRLLHGRHHAAIMEDSDVLLADRMRDGNHIMSRILNVSDGLIDLSGKKMIFTANLRSLDQIDEAITRAGRCFDVIQFRRLTQDEADAAAKALGVEAPTGMATYGIGDIVAKQESVNRPAARFGFAPALTKRPEEHSYQGNGKA